MDSTYKTNKYKLHLLEFVGITSTKLTFLTAFAFMTSKKEDDFAWALERCRDLLKCPDHPQVVVIDWDVPHMNVVDRVFLKSTTLLCRYHVTMNVKSNIKAKCLVKEYHKEKGKAIVVYKYIMRAWENLLDSETKESHADFVLMFRQVCAESPIFVEYVEGTILGPVKEIVVRAWTNHVMHLGNTMTNMVESTHARLKL